jgi:hypothetical protein
VRRPRISLRVTLLGLALSASVVTIAMPAHGAPLSLHHVVTHTDGNDNRSPLDLRSLKLAHLGPRFDRLTFSTWGPVSNTELLPATHGNFALGIDLNNRPVHYERWVYVDVVRGHLRGEVFDPSTRHFVKTSATRSGQRQFHVMIPLKAIGRPASYRFALFSTYRAGPCHPHPASCTDSIPNRRPLLLQDLRAPTVAWGAMPVYTSRVSANLSYPTHFTVLDDPRGSHVKHWSLQQLVVGQTVWKPVAGGTTGGPHSVSVHGKEGKAYHLRVVAMDHAGNTRVSAIKPIIFPFDDVRAGYSAGWTASGASDAFLGTTSQSTTPGDTATFVFKGSQACVLGMPTLATGAAATVSMDGHPTSAGVSETDTTNPRQALACYAVSHSGTHTLVITVGAGPAPFVLDGFIVSR